ncbi:MAG: hypothetical protein ACLUAR_20105 [Pilosibacter sp.]
MNSDGSIIIDTKINTDGIANGERRSQKEFARVADGAEKTGEKDQILVGTVRQF